jgi:hypothetical protein
MPFQISLPCSHIDMASCTKYVCEKCATFMKRFYLGKWIIKTRKLLSPLKPNDNYSTIFVLTISSPPFCIYAYLMILIMNSNYYLKQHQSFNPCNGEVLCSLRGTAWNLKYYLDEPGLQGVRDFRFHLFTCQPSFHQCFELAYSR